MTFSDYIAISALLISIVSLFVSWYYNFRDRAQLKTSAQFYGVNEYNDTPYITIKVVNCGKRPTILTRFGGDLKGGGWSAERLKDGFRLGEHEVFERTVGPEDLVTMGPEDEEEYINFWVENTLGQRFKIKDIEKLIKQLASSKS